MPAQFRNKEKPPIRWHLPELLEKIGEQRVEEYNATVVAREAGIAVSTVYAMLEREPRRLDVKSLAILMVYLNKQLGVTSLDDLIEFEELEQPRQDS